MSGPDSSPSLREDGLRGMTALGAMGWTLGSMFAAALLPIMVMAIRGDKELDFVTALAGQVIGWSAILFVMLRWYAPDASIRRFLALRATDVRIYPLALLLGVALWLPFQHLFTVILERFPVEGGGLLEKTLSEAAGARLVLLVVFVAVVAPLLEEIVFRGALFGPLLLRARKLSPFALLPRDGDQESQAPRRSAGIEAVLLVSVMFAWVHHDWQKYGPIFLLALMLGTLRLRSGSLLPSLLVHIGFNSTPAVLSAIKPELELEQIARWISVVSASAALALVVVLLKVTASERCARARAEELGA